MNYKRLLAKKSKSPDAPNVHETLAGHIMDVVAVADTLVSSWGGVFLTSMGLSESLSGALASALLKGALLHDLGKANHQFQRMIRSEDYTPQAVRHELISLAILLRFEMLDRWLFPDGDDLVRKAALFALVGHHLRIPDGNALIPRDGSGDSKVMVFTSHVDVASLLSETGKKLGFSGALPVLGDIEVDLLVDSPLSEISIWIQEAKRWWNSASFEDRRFIALVKALVLAADVAGSALPRTMENAEGWVRDVLSSTCRPADLKRLASRRLEGKPMRPFQEEVAKTTARITLVRAGCGSGKTTAAYLWGSRKASGKKLFFSYPTTGTATEGYADYVLPDDIDSALIHSRTSVDIERLLSAEDEEGGWRLELLKIEALQGWDVPLVVCTADTVLGIVQNNRRGLYAFPAIGNGAFVFDEIHAYDDRMFGALLRFLDAFPKAPVLLMTASLPQARLNMLSCKAAEFGEQLAVFDGPRELEEIPRYKIKRASLEEVWPKIETALSYGGKVLWVANTVERAVSFAKEAENRGLNPLPYHSRYRYCDRIERHRTVIDTFKGSGSALAVTTQVCEVSLDISADLLITDIAPVPALIQRLGRLNRRVTPENPGQPRTTFFLEPDTHKPYEKYDLHNARTWIDRLIERPLSQSDLARGFLEVCSDGTIISRVDSAWLDGGPFSAPAPLREAGVTIPVIREEDTAGIKLDRSKIVNLMIPMVLGPVTKEIPIWPRQGGSWIAPAGRIEYSERWGARWRKR